MFRSMTASEGQRALSSLRRELARVRAMRARVKGYKRHTQPGSTGVEAQPRGGRQTLTWLIARQVAEGIQCAYVSPVARAR